MRTAELTLFAWIPVCLVLFSTLRPRHALIVSYIAGRLFLPVYGIDLPWRLAYSKLSASAYGALFGAVRFGLDRLLSFRPKWFGLPMRIWRLSALFASLHKSPHLGLYDSLSACLTEIVQWGIA